MRPLIFSLFFCILLLTLSYKIIIELTPVTINQETTLNFLTMNQDLQMNYTTAETSHLEDVKKVMNVVDYLFLLSLLISTLIITHHRKNWKTVKEFLYYGSLTSLLVTIIILLAILLNFNSSFTIFHQIFFPQGNWTFPADSLLIQTFPIKFFIEIGRNILLLALGLSGLSTIFFKFTKFK
jgi:integral membrane protein (TIGR01906 family)